MSSGTLRPDAVQLGSNVSIEAFSALEDFRFLASSAMDTIEMWTWIRLSVAAWRRRSRKPGAQQGHRPFAFDDKSGMQDEMSVKPLFGHSAMTESTRNGMSSLRISTIETSLRR